MQQRTEGTDALLGCDAEANPSPESSAEDRVFTRSAFDKIVDGRFTCLRYGKGG